MTHRMYVAEAEIVALAKLHEPYIRRVIVHRQPTFLHEQSVGVRPRRPHRDTLLTVVQYLRSKGDDEAADKAPKNEITACLGSGSSKCIRQLQIIEIEREYTGYIITSDGIHDYLDEDELEFFISQNDYSDERFKLLINSAKEQGSCDDKSIIIIKC